MASTGVSNHKDSLSIMQVANMGSVLQDIDSIIVSDNRFQLKLLANQLSIASFHSITAFDDVFNALDYLNGTVMHATVVFLDLNMEDNSALEFLKRLGKTEFDGSVALLTDGDDIKTHQAIKLARTFELKIIDNLELPAQDEQLDRLIDNIIADFAASDRGKQIYKYSPQRLREAIERGELFNVYQPKVLLSSGA
ncbi:MAG: response regulator, partial [Gammaproteobacteria bacterium]